jgi:hypothetical protein
VEVAKRPEVQAPSELEVGRRLDDVERALKGVRADVEQQAQVTREGFDRTERMLAEIKARLPGSDQPVTIQLQPPPTRLDIAIGVVRGWFSRLVGE